MTMPAKIDQRGVDKRQGLSSDHSDLDFRPEHSIKEQALKEEAERIAASAKSEGREEQGENWPKILRYAVCPGLAVEYIHYLGERDAKISNPSNSDWDFRIDHCLEGCIECYLHLKDEEENVEVSYLNHGQFAINDGSVVYDYCKFPQGLYRGVSIVIRTSLMEEMTIKMLEKLGITPESVQERYIQGEHVLLAADSGHVGQLLLSLYEIEELEDPAYMQLKAMEIMRLLVSGPEIELLSLNHFSPKLIEGLRKEVDSLIMGRAEGEVSLPELIRKSGLETGEFYELFEEIYGESPGRFIREYSLRAAHELLRETDLAVKDVAKRTGFNTSSKFSTTFKRRFGLSPKDFRQQQLRNN